MISNSQDTAMRSDRFDHYAIWFDNLSENEIGPVKYHWTHLNKFINHLQKKQHRYKDPVDFLSYVYFKVHRKYLGRYQTPSTMDDLLLNRNYDCLTGTALYGMIFDRLNIPYEIVETSYHIYLSLEVNHQTVLIESTSPLNGFIYNKEAIADLLTRYRQDLESNSTSEEKHFQISEPVNNLIGLDQLAGLQYYNLAVAAYNQKDLKQALANMSKALDYYPSTRVKEVMGRMLDTLDEDKNFDALLKDAYLSRFNHLRHTLVTANREK